MKKATCKQAYQIAKKRGVDVRKDGITFYATNDKETEIYCFETKKERDAFITAYNNKFKN